MNQNKPKWMSLETWTQFVHAHAGDNGNIECVGCSSDTDMTVDHIVPRVKGGGDELRNLQPMCRKCNSTKGGRPDVFWNKHHYFDTPINRENLRISQDDFTYSPVVEEREFFSRPFSEINRKMYLYAQIVGAGKTLGMFALPFALNECADDAAPRVDKMMIVTKDSQLRRQIVNELRNEPTQYGIINQAPVVLEIKRGEDLYNTEYHDIAVMCPNMLWPSKDGSIIDDLGNVEDVCVNWSQQTEQVLKQYPLIVFDEMHYAYQNISSLIQIATNSLVFGFTASPIDGEGDLIEDMVRMSVYGYREATINDSSMKWLGNDSDYKALSEVKASDYKTLEGWSGQSSDDGMASGLVTIRSVVTSTVKRLWELDNNEGKQILALHREKGFMLGDTYPAHAIIVVPDVETAKDQVLYLNKMFGSNRERFPASEGWKATTAYGTSKEKFDETHPFFRYLNSGKLSRNCSRVLVVVDMACEGMNNKNVLLLGIAKKSRSVLEQVQRIGRGIRSTHYTVDGQKYAPPVNHDRIQVITHESYGNAEKITQALDFMYNMYDATQDIRSLEQHIEQGLGYDEEDSTYRATLNYSDNMLIIDTVGFCILNGKRLSTKGLVNQIGGRKQAKRELVMNMAKRVHNGNKDDIEKVAKAIFYQSLPSPLETLAVDEVVHLNAMDSAACKQWVEDNQIGKMNCLHAEGSEEWVDAVNQIHRLVDTKAFRNTRPELRQSSMSVLEELVGDCVSITRLGDGIKDVIHSFVCEAAMDYMQGEGAVMADFEEDGRLCIPEVVQELRNENWRSVVKRWVMWELFKNGYMPNLGPIFEVLEGDYKVS